MDVENPQLAALEALVENVNVIPDDELVSIANMISRLRAQYEGQRTFNDLHDVSALLRGIVNYRNTYKQ